MKAIYKTMIIPSKRLTPHYYEFERLKEEGLDLTAQYYLTKHRHNIEGEYLKMMDVYEHRVLKVGTNEEIHKSADGNSLRS